MNRWVAVLLTFIVIVVILAGFSYYSPPETPEIPDLSPIRLPPGFSIEVYAENVPGAREMTLGSRVWFS